MNRADVRIILFVLFFIAPAVVVGEWIWSAI